jgi:DNA-binding transcriptional regulator YdaS (Cro superfamily)
MSSVDHAAELVGGYEALGQRLGVRTEQVMDWSLGLVKPNAATLLFVLDVIMQETQKLSRASAAFELAGEALAKARRSSKAT